jgi:hypothetical protein
MTPACARYRIDKAVVPHIIGNGVIDMDCLGSNAKQLMPLSLGHSYFVISTLCAAVASAFDQGYGMPDVKAENVCLTPAHDWLVVDVDNLPLLHVCARGHATYQARDVTCCGGATIVSLVLTAAYVLMGISLEGLEEYHHSVRQPPAARLATLCPMPLLGLLVHINNFDRERAVCELRSLHTAMEPLARGMTMQEDSQQCTSL